MPVQVIVARDWPSLIRAEAAHKVDYAIDSALAYAVASKLCACVEPVAAPLAADGSPGTRAVVIVRKGMATDLGSAAKLRIAVGPGAFAGVQTLAVAALEKAGAAHLSRAASWSAADAAFARGDADVLVGWQLSRGEAGAGTLARLGQAGLSGADYSVVWKSDVLRYGPHVVRADLDPEARRILSHFLVTLKDDDPDVYDLIEHAHDGGMAAASAADYRPALAMVDFVRGNGGSR